MRNGHTKWKKERKKRKKFCPLHSFCTFKSSWNLKTNRWKVFWIYTHNLWNYAILSWNTLCDISIFVGCYGIISFCSLKSRKTKMLVKWIKLKQLELLLIRLERVQISVPYWHSFIKLPKIKNNNNNKTLIKAKPKRLEVTAVS